MNVWRVGIAVVAAIVALVSIANIAIHHAPEFFPIVLIAIYVFALALFERGRYVGVSTFTSRNARATGELFYDPSTGVMKHVYYDATTGLREYR